MTAAVNETPARGIDESERPYASIVVEWENARHSAAGRSAAMLHEVRRQASEVAAAAGAADNPKDSPYFELIAVYDDGEFDPGVLTALFQDCLGPSDAALSWRLLPTRHSGYYRNKHRGARAASGKIVVFVDSDVIPESNWLWQLIRALDDPAVSIVAGNTYVQPCGLVGKAFALFWFFPLRDTDGALRPVRSFFINNLAMRREIYLAHPLVDMEGTSRGACLILADRLDQAGIPVYWNPKARVAHPTPNGIVHASRRALVQGRDRLYRERQYGDRWSASLPGSCWRWLRHLGGSAAKIGTRFPRVGLNPLQVPAAIAVAWYYYTVYWVGEILSHLGIPAIRRIRV